MKDTTVLRKCKLFVCLLLNVSLMSNIVAESSWRDNCKSVCKKTAYVVAACTGIVITGVVVTVGLLCLKKYQRLSRRLQERSDSPTESSNEDSFLNHLVDRRDTSEYTVHYYRGSRRRNNENSDNCTPIQPVPDHSRSAANSTAKSNSLPAVNSQDRDRKTPVTPIKVNGTNTNRHPNDDGSFVDHRESISSTTVNPTHVVTINSRITPAESTLGESTPGTSGTVTVNYFDDALSLVEQAQHTIEKAQRTVSAVHTPQYSYHYPLANNSGNGARLVMNNHRTNNGLGLVTINGKDYSYPTKNIQCIAFKADAYGIHSTVPLTPK